METKIRVEILELKELLRQATKLSKHQDFLNMYQAMIDTKNEELEMLKCGHSLEVKGLEVKGLEVKGFEVKGIYDKQQDYKIDFS